MHLHQNHPTHYQQQPSVPKKSTLGLLLRKNQIIKGTLILTIAGFITRILGFFYRIFLADCLGASLLGTYQLIFPVYGIAFTIYGAGIQTAISQVIASSCAASGHSSQGSQTKSCPSARRILLYGLGISLCLSLSLLLLIQNFAQPIAAYLLLEPACTPYLRILSLLFPFCGITACLHGYYYGMQNAKIPAITQIVEQISRLGFVFLILCLFPVPPEQGCIIAVWGLVVGELVSCVYVIHHFIQTQIHKKHTAAIHMQSLHSRKHQIGIRIRALPENHLWLKLITVSATLTTTRLIVSILNSTEAVFIPAALRMYGYSGTEALALYGILTGMVMPFLLFPSSITNSIAVMLLPAVADSNAMGQQKQVKHYVLTSTLYCLLIGFIFTVFFLLFGNLIGELCFHNQTAGSFLRILSWLCPFLYLSTTLNSIINGLGKNHQTFLITVVSQSIKLYSLVFCVPRFGIHAYLTGILVSQIVMATLSCMCLRKYFRKNSES